MSLLTEYSARPLPALTSKATALDYNLIPIQRDHPLSHECLVEVGSLGLAAESYYSRRDGLNAPYCSIIAGSLEKVWCRNSVAKKLCEINNKLRVFGLELFLLDAYRPIACQQALWDFYIERARRTLDNPTPERCRQHVGQYWSDPSKFNEGDFRTWPTHATGAAIDLTIRRVSTGECLFMGGVFDDSAEVSYTRYYESLPCDTSTSDYEARRNRRILFWLMVEAGFANYSYEWWHFDLGNQMWVMNRNMLPKSGDDIRAYYGYISAPIEAQLLR